MCYFKPSGVVSLGYKVKQDLSPYYHIYKFYAPIYNVVDESKMGSMDSCDDKDLTYEEVFQ